MAEGDAVELGRVLLIADDKKVTIGTPIVDGAKVMATSQGEGRTKKIIVLHYKPKRRYRKKMGHRQLYTRLAIDEIVEPGVVASEPAKKTGRSKKEVTEGGA